MVSCFVKHNDVIEINFCWNILIDFMWAGINLYEARVEPASPNFKRMSKTEKIISF